MVMVLCVWLPSVVIDRLPLCWASFIALLDILFVISPNIDCDAAVFEIHLILSFYLRTVLFVQHAHRAFGGGALLEQGIGAWRPEPGRKGVNIMHAASAAEAARRAKIFRFIGGSSFAKIITGGGYALRYFDYLTLYRILEATCVNRPKAA